MVTGFFNEVINVYSNVVPQVLDLILGISHLFFPRKITIPEFCIMINL